ncbi:hypothetical protein [Mumia sp. DW29H23]|uniref:hypothetical protein n=1 Tax=Mumia sp. DW29H23 TaxID=3421241 RepID=UPI003D680274
MGAPKLATYVQVGDRVFAAGDVPPREYAEQITNPKAWVDGVVPGFDSDDEPGYASLTKAKLQEEIDLRNADREEGDQIVVEGTNKDALVGALVADDARTAGSDDTGDDTSSDD